MDNIIPFKRPVSAERADGVMAAVNIAARRLGYSENMAYRVGRSAKQRYRDGKASAAKVVADFTAELRQDAEQVTA